MPRVEAVAISPRQASLLLGVASPGFIAQAGQTADQGAPCGPGGMAMSLSEHEREVLRRLDADFGRHDPRLAWRLTELTTLERDVRVSWRPPRLAVAVALVMVAGVVFMLTAIIVSMRPPCRTASPSSTAIAMTSPTAKPSRSQVQKGSARSVVPQHSRSSSPSSC